MTPRRVIVRADASASIGTGHVMRCLTLAGALIERGWSAALATRDLPAGLRRAADRAGVTTIEIVDPADLGTLDAHGRRWDDRPADLVIVDHYGLDAAWIESMRVRGTTWMAIDDVADRALPVDLLLDQNLGSRPEQYRKLVPSTARLLIGPTYALVRPAFARRRMHRPVSTGHVDRILIFIGGADPDEVTARVVTALEDVEVALDIVVGGSYRGLEGLRAAIDRRPDATLHVDTDDMADLMDRADLAIGAPSSASWERCTLGLPTVLITVADNQRMVERELVAHGAATSLGWHLDASARAIRDEVDALRSDPGRVRAMARAAFLVTDGQGADRVAAAIEDLVSARTEAR